MFYLYVTKLQQKYFSALLHPVCLVYCVELLNIYSFISDSAGEAAIAEQCHISVFSIVPKLVLLGVALIRSALG